MVRLLLYQESRPLRCLVVEPEALDGKKWRRGGLLFYGGKARCSKRRVESRVVCRYLNTTYSRRRPDYVLDDMAVRRLLSEK